MNQNCPLVLGSRQGRMVTLDRRGTSKVTTPAPGPAPAYCLDAVPDWVSGKGTLNQVLLRRGDRWEPGEAKAARTPERRSCTGSELRRATVKSPWILDRYQSVHTWGENPRGWGKSCWKGRGWAIPEVNTRPGTVCIPAARTAWPHNTRDGRRSPQREAHEFLVLL